MPDNQSKPYREPITVFTGEIKCGRASAVLKSSPIGSCVVVIIFDQWMKAGVMAHVMLPGSPPDKKEKIPGRYATYAIRVALYMIGKSGADLNRIKAVTVGGGNVLRRKNDTIGEDNLNAVNALLKNENIPVVASSVGGMNRKSARFDIENGSIYVADGDHPEELFYQFNYKSRKFQK